MLQRGRQGPRSALGRQCHARAAATRAFARLAAKPRVCARPLRGAVLDEADCTLDRRCRRVCTMTASATLRQVHHSADALDVSRRPERTTCENVRGKSRGYRVGDEPGDVAWRAALVVQEAGQSSELFEPGRPMCPQEQTEHGVRTSAWTQRDLLG
ncbi:hypothetical protein GCM10017687_01870 [Streptomyces echinatus]